MQPRSADSDVSRSLILMAASLGFVVVQLDVTIVNVGMRQLGDSFGSSVAGLQWVVDAYTIVFASLIPTAGVLADRRGAKRVFIAGFAIFTLASLACAAAPNLLALIVARGVQGVGAAALVPCSLALLNHAFHDEAARAKAVGIWAAGASVALAAGPVIGGTLITTIGWRSIFFINLQIGLVGIWLTLRYAAESVCSDQRGLDVAGQLAIVLALAALAGVAIEGGRLGLGHPRVIAIGVLFVAAAGSFLAIEAKGRSPLLPLSLFGNATFSAAVMVGLLINVAYYGLVFLFSLFFQRAKGYTPLMTGAAFLPMTGGVLVTNLVAGSITAKRGPRLPMVVGQAAFIAGCLCLIGITPNTPFSHIWWPLLLIGGGLGLVVAPMTTAVLGAVERTQSGIGSGALNATRQAGSVIGVALYGSLIADQGQFARGTHIALYLSAGLLVLGFGVALRYVAVGHRVGIANRAAGHVVSR